MNIINDMSEFRGSYQNRLGNHRSFSTQNQVLLGILSKYF